MKDFPLDPLKSKHHLVEKKAVKVKAWKVLRETLYYKEFQAKQPTLCQNLREQEQVQMRNRPR